LYLLLQRLQVESPKAQIPDCHPEAGMYGSAGNAQYR
jgi:hypothetical protein